MDFKALKTFHTIVELDGFQKAADVLQYAQSTVTVQIQNLESDLGVKLFDRHGKRVKLTEEGRLLSLKTGSLLNAIEDIKRLLTSAGSGYAGRVRIAANEPSASLRLPMILADFCRERPQVQLSLDVGGTEFITETIAEGRADFGLCSPPVTQTNLFYEPLFDEQFVLLVSTQNPLANRPDLTMDDLSTERILMKERTCQYRAMIERSLMEQVSYPGSGVEVGSFEALKGMVQANLGVSFVPEISAAQLPPGTVARTLVDTTVHLPIGLLYRTDLTMSKAAQSLLEIFRGQLRQAGRESRPLSGEAPALS
ncbi:LysR family transcriptional regulator [Alicyclobacillus sp. SO9]|uniref:LysR family transcriptional regulator n=1 Tax=Alicyclobacillus sp. SO9 TaxID=2665646 RepID=UPI0018E724BD|nr:LysR family transcriptional regulator [Alicyclobacillus sp. SO9]QQE78251.1 LysR family transcriptional regulator [Alicyclobacillus sp. SO9]